MSKSTATEVYIREKNNMNTTQLFAPQIVKVKDTFNDTPFSMDVCVYPHPQTLHFVNLIQRAQKDDADAAEAYAEALSLLIPDWDIEMDGKPFPPSQANFLRIPKDFVDHVFEKAANTVKDAEPKITFMENGEKKGEGVEKLEITVKDETAKSEVAAT